MLLHRKGRARRLVHDGRGMVVVMMHDDGRGRSGRRRRDNFFHVLVSAPLADRVEPHTVGPREQQQIRDPVPVRNQPVSRANRIEWRDTHTNTPSSWRRIDGVEAMIEPWAETRRDI